MLTKVIFSLIVGGVFVQRLIELGISKRNVSAILAQGGREVGSNSLWIVKVLQISWFVAMLVEVWALDRPFIPVLSAIAFLFVLMGQGLRYLSMQALGPRWTLPITTVPEGKVIETGVYRYLRHPNWLGVIFEIFFLPLVHTAYLSAIAFSIANAFVIAKRVVREEEALSEDSNYGAVFAHRPRFMPFLLKRQVPQ